MADSRSMVVPGLWGVAGAGLFFPWSRLRREFRRRHGRLATAVGITASFGLVALACRDGAGFGVHLLRLACLDAVLVAALCDLQRHAIADVDNMVALASGLALAVMQSGWSNTVVGAAFGLLFVAGNGCLRGWRFGLKGTSTAPVGGLAPLGDIPLWIVGWAFVGLQDYGIAAAIALTWIVGIRVYARITQSNARYGITAPMAAVIALQLMR